MIKISIIMPLYNAEKYLGEALQSIQKQIFHEYEIICIDDASTDSTIDILRQFQKKDNRIKILINSEHSGAAISRNKGILEAKGKYLSFLDGDDIFDEVMLKLSYEEIEKYNADIVMFEYKHVTDKHIYEKISIQRNRLFMERYCKRTFSIQEFEPIEFMNWTCAPCNKLYRKSFIDSNQIKFQTLACANDVYFVTMALLSCTKLIMLEDRRVMLYAREHNVVTRISYDRDPMCTYWAMMKIRNELRRKGLFDKLFQYYYCALYYNLCYAIVRTKRIKDARCFFDFLQKEGIDNFTRETEDYYLKTDENIRMLLENYKKLNFVTEWYKYEGRISFYLFKNKEKVLSFFRAYIGQNKQIVIWGAGKNGSALLDFLRINSIQKLEVVDSDVNKQKTIIRGYEIKKPEDCLKNAEIVITSSYAIYSEVVVTLTQRNIEIIDVGEILEMPQ